MAEQVPHEVKIERTRAAGRGDAGDRPASGTRRGSGRVDEVLVEGRSRTDASLLRGRTRRNTTVNFDGDAAPGSLVDVLVDGATSTTLRGRQRALATVCRQDSSMRVLVTGSSGQIGTNLALRLLADGHQVFGVDKRLNTWVPDAFPTLLQDLAGHYPSFRGGIGGVEYPEVDIVVHLAAHAKVHQLVREPHRALENAIMTFNVLEYARAIGLPLIFSSTREVYGDVHRFEEYAEEAADFAYTESPYSASKITSEAFVYSYARCYGLRYLVFRFSNVYGRYDSDLWRMERVLPLVDAFALAGRADHDLRRRGEAARLHLHRRLRRRHRPWRLRSRGGLDHERDDQPRLRRGKHARPCRRADRGGARTSSRRSRCRRPCSAR